MIGTLPTLADIDLPEPSINIEDVGTALTTIMLESGKSRLSLTCTICESATEEAQAKQLMPYV